MLMAHSPFYNGTCSPNLVRNGRFFGENYLWTRWLVCDFSMDSRMIDVVVSELVREDLTWEKLVSIQTALRQMDGETPAERIVVFALSHLVADILSYFEFVADELEKSVAISHSDEFERLSKHMKTPAGESTLERVNDLIDQWATFDRYRSASFDDVALMGE